MAQSEVRLWDVPRNVDPVKCRGCGKLIVWGKTPRGKNIPLSIEHPDSKWEGPLQSSICVKAPAHFADCPKSQEFRGGAR